MDGDRDGPVTAAAELLLQSTPLRPLLHSALLQRRHSRRQTADRLPQSAHVPQDLHRLQVALRQRLTAAPQWNWLEWRVSRTVLKVLTVLSVGSSAGGLERK